MWESAALPIGLEREEKKERERECEEEIWD